MRKQPHYLSENLIFVTANIIQTDASILPSCLFTFVTTLKKYLKVCGPAEKIHYLQMHVVFHQGRLSEVESCASDRGYNDLIAHDVCFLTLPPVTSQRQY